MTQPKLNIDTASIVHGAFNAFFKDIKKERLVVAGTDSFIVKPLHRERTLFSQIAKLSEYKHVSDSLITDKNAQLKSCKEKNVSLGQQVELMQERIEGKDVIIADWQDKFKLVGKKWFKITLYSSGAGALAGLIAGILIAK